MRSPFFVVGCPRSGTTLLSVLLDRHSQIAVPPETDFYNDIAPRIAQHENYDLSRLLAEWRRLPELGLQPEQVARRCGEHPTGGALLSGMLELYAANMSREHVGEKTPQHLWHVPRIFDDFPEAQILCLVRDGRDVALSLGAMPWWTGGLAGGADLWLDAFRLADGLESQFPSRFRTFRYEDLVSRPEATLATVMSFLGFDVESEQFSRRPSGVVLSRSMEWKGLALEPVDMIRVGHRRCFASAKEMAYLDRVLGTTLRRLGYP